MDRIIAGIDVGTTKICTLVGRISEDGALHIVGMGLVPARGVRKGVITDIEVASRAVGESVRKAQKVSGYTVSEAYVGVGGSHISSQNSRGVVAIGKGDRPVDRDDVERAMEAAQAIAIPHNRRIIHSIPREFIVDGQNGIKNPLGLMGFRLEVEAHLVTGAATSIQNLVRCVEINQIQVLDLVLQPLASAEAVLREEEKKMGVVVVDIGGGTTDLATYVEGSVWETLVFAMGGNHITKDIAVIQRTSLATAEDLKIRYGNALSAAIDESEVIEFATFGGDNLRSIPRRELCQIVEARTEEMFDIMAQEIRRSGLDGLLPAGVVITGGSASLRGIREVALRKLQLPVRIGMPHTLHGLVEAISSPAYATSVGLLLWGMGQQTSALEDDGLIGVKNAWHRQLREWLRLLLPR